MRRLASFALAASGLLLCSVLLAQPGGAPTPEQKASQRFTNLQVLGDLPANRLTWAMLFMANSLGVGCSYCHNMDNRASDEKPAKLRAREMLRMVQQLNAANFGGQPRITCFTCHRGHVSPASAISIPRLAGPLAPPPAGGAATVDGVLDRYVQASGGRAAIERLRNRVARGRLLLSGGTDVPAEIVTTPDLFLSALAAGTPDATTTSVSAQGGWRRSGNAAASDLDRFEVERYLRENDLWMPLRLRARYATLEYGGAEQLEGVPVTILDATTIVPNTRYRLYFDNATGLLTRLVIESASPFGWNPQAIDYYDYRRVDGVMVPFAIRRTFPDHWQAYIFSSIRHNQHIDPARFARPAAAPAPGQARSS